jgi:DNA-binding FrmR family transcriptional regulator
VSAVQDNVAAAEANIAAIIDGTTEFTGDVVMQQALTVSGNLYVIGAQVDLGISSAQIDDATLLLAANTPADAQLGVDSGIVINRGQDANVFFGFAQYGDHIDFIFTDAPADNTVHYPIQYVDVHANTFGTEATTTAAFTAFHDTDAVNTGIYWPESNIGFSVGGVNKANIYTDGISAHGVYSQGVELRANDSATYLAALSNDYVTHTQITANLDIVQDNVATLTTTVDNFGSYANTNLDTKSNVSATYIQLNANIDVVQDNVASITARSDAFGTYANTTFSTVSNAEALATGIATKLDSSDYTASDVLTKIKTVDGAGSGLDADLLDGQTSTYFAVEATRSANASALAAGIAGITPIGTSDISNGAVTIDKLAATLDLGALYKYILTTG